MSAGCAAYRPITRLSRHSGIARIRAQISAENAARSAGDRLSSVSRASSFAKGLWPRAPLLLNRTRRTSRQAKFRLHCSPLLPGPGAFFAPWKTGKNPPALPRPRVRKAAPAHRKVGLRPEKGWHKRNFFTQVLIPSLFTKRHGSHLEALFPTCPGRPDRPHLDRPRFVPDPDARAQHAHRSELGEVAEGHQADQASRPAFHDLPKIDLVLVTHAHFDHLDRKTLREVADEQPIVVPFEVGNLVHDLGFHSVHELALLGELSARAAENHAHALPSLGRARCCTIRIAASADTSSRRAGARFSIAATRLISTASRKSASGTRSTSR